MFSEAWLIQHTLQCIKNKSCIVFYSRSTTHERVPCNVGYIIVSNHQSTSQRFKQMKLSR